MLDVLIENASVPSGFRDLGKEAPDMHKKGWIVPIAVGFHGLTQPGEAARSRDPKTPHAFAESVLTLGEFKMLHHITNFADIFWKTEYDQDSAMYVCKSSSQSL